jgi:hypothetical protein
MQIKIILAEIIQNQKVAEGARLDSSQAVKYLHNKHNFSQLVNKHVYQLGYQGCTHILNCTVYETEIN